MHVVVRTVVVDALAAQERIQQRQRLVEHCGMNAGGRRLAERAIFGLGRYP